MRTALRMEGVRKKNPSVRMGSGRSVHCRAHCYIRPDYVWITAWSHIAKSAWGRALVFPVFKYHISTVQKNKYKKTLYTQKYMYNTFEKIFTTIYFIRGIHQKDKYIQENWPVFILLGRDFICVACKTQYFWMKIYRSVTNMYSFSQN